MAECEVVWILGGLEKFRSEIRNCWNERSLWDWFI